MNLRFARAILTALLLLQTGLLAPAVMAVDAGQGMSDCAEHLGTSDNDCPCCPQSISAHGGCGTLCLGVSAGISNTAGILTCTRARAGSSLPASLLVSQTYTPVNPPPIA